MTDSNSYQITPKDHSAQIADWRDRSPSSDWLESFLRTGIPLAGRTVLDCGCGFGFYGSMLAGRGAFVDGVDREDECLAAAANRMPLYRNLYKSRIENIDQRIGSYDVILMRYVLHHIPLAKRVEALRNLMGHIADSGHLLIETAFSDQMARHYDYEIFPELHEAQREIYPSRKELSCLLGAAGYRHVREIETIQVKEPYPSVESALVRSERLVTRGDGPTGWLLLSQDQRVAFHHARSTRLPMMFGSGVVPRVWVGSLLTCTR